MRNRSYAAVAMGLAVLATMRADVVPAVVISQVSSNFIELFNRSAHVVSIEGWSVQYSQAGTKSTGPATWNAIPVSGSLAPGQYYLVGVNTPGNPIPDTNGDFPLRIPFSYGLFSTGSVALVSKPSPLLAAWPSATDYVDLFGYGFNTAPAEGTPFPSQVDNFTWFGPKSAFRKQAGCLSTHNNATDFELADLVLRNRQTPLSPCGIAPQIKSNGIVNASSGMVGPIAPSELLNILGSNLGSIASDGNGARAFFDDAAVPVQAVNESQIRVVAPAWLSPGSQTKLRVEVDGVASNTLTLAVVPQAPAILTSNGSGGGQALARNEDGKPNIPERGARPESVLSFSASGMGVNPSADVIVTVGGQAVEIISISPEDGSGIRDIAVRLPAGSEGRQPLQLSIDGVPTQPDVYVSVALSALAPPSYFALDISGANDLAYDPGSHRLYVCVAANSDSSPGSVAVVNPSTGEILQWLATRPNPQLLALSDDGRYLYVSLTNTIQRIDLQTGSEDLFIKISDIYPNSAFGFPVVLDMQVLPGQPQSIALAILSNYNTGGQGATVIVDNGVRRPVGGPALNSIRYGSPGVLLADSRPLLIAPDGLKAGRPYPTNLDSGYNVVQRAGDRLITDTGFVFSDNGSELLAQFALPVVDKNGFVYRPDTDRVYFAGWVSGYTNIVVEEFDPRKLAPVGFLQLVQQPNQRAYGTPGRLVSVGPAGLATVSRERGSERIFVFPLSSIQAFTPVALPRPNGAGSDLRRFQVATNSFAANHAGTELYLSLPSYATGIANSVVKFDIATGSFGQPLWVGSEPDALAVSSDDQYLYVALDGARRVVRLQLPDLKIDSSFPIHTNDVADPIPLAGVSQLLSIPSQPRAIAVGRIQSFLAHSRGWAIYDDGIQRHDFTVDYASPTGRNGPAVDEAQVSDDGSFLFGEEGESSDVRFSRWRITPGGLDFDAQSASAFGGPFYQQLACQRNRCLTGGGFLADTATLDNISRVASTTNDTFPALDLDNNRLYLAVSGRDVQIVSFDATSFQQTGLVTIPQAGRVQTFQRLKGGQLALTTGSELIVVPASMLR